MEAFRGCYTFGHSDPWQLPQVALNSVCTTCLSQAFKGSAASMLRSHQRGHEKCPTLHSSLDCNEDTEQHNMIANRSNIARHGAGSYVAEREELGFAALRAMLFDVTEQAAGSTWVFMQRTSCTIPICWQRADYPRPMPRTRRSTSCAA